MCNVSYSIGDPQGRDNTHCARCGNATAGERWPWYVLVQKRTHAPQKTLKGLICEDCVNEINHQR